MVRQGKVFWGSGVVPNLLWVRQGESCGLGLGLVPNAGLDKLSLVGWGSGVAPNSGLDTVSLLGWD